MVDAYKKNPHLKVNQISKHMMFNQVKAAKNVNIIAKPKKRHIFAISQKERSEKTV